MRGGGEDSPETAQEAEAPQFESPQAAATVTPISPANARWGTQAACTTDTDFVAIAGAVTQEAAYLSRHVACVKLISGREEMKVATMPKANGVGKELCKISAGRSCSMESAGYATFQTKWQIYGPSNVLKKTVSIETTMTKWEWNPSFSLGKPTLTFAAKPQIECGTTQVPNGGSVKPCSYTVPQISLTTTAGNKATATFDVGFDWGYVAGIGEYDVASHYVLSGGLTYKATQADMPAGQPWEQVMVHSYDKGDSFRADVRCDRKVTGSKQGSGCVMPQASAVLVMDSAAGSAHSEAAAHVRAAQTTVLPGMSSKAPGVYLGRTNTRSVADTSSGAFINMGLLYSQLFQTDNRNAACLSSTSLFKTRPHAGSASCPASATSGCSCDEYPFATTNMGAYQYPGSTSVRRISTSHNVQGGTVFSTFLNAERVLPLEAGTDYLWVYVK